MILMSQMTMQWQHKQIKQQELKETNELYSSNSK
jgi:hypothetical protein